MPPQIEELNLLHLVDQFGKATDSGTQRIMP
jgi:hypothetical protein